MQVLNQTISICHSQRDEETSRICQKEQGKDKGLVGPKAGLQEGSLGGNELMPKPGFKSITISQKTYDLLFNHYLRHKESLKMKGIQSFSGYTIWILNEAYQKNKVFARMAPKIEKISTDEDEYHQRILLKDNIKNRIAEVLIKKQPKSLWCCLCERDDCIHVGFCYSLPDIYPFIGERLKSSPPVASSRSKFHPP